MEVHHHGSHNPERPKRFKEYFLEFLMIFLAVALGFFAENGRESLVDSRRTHEYMKEIVENLKYDTTRVSVNLATTKIAMMGMDSLRNEIHLAAGGNINSNRLYYFAKTYAGVFGTAVFNTSTITELKSSGSLRLVKNKKLVSDLDDYYQRRTVAADAFRPSTQLREDQRRMLNEYFSWKYFDDQIQNSDKTSPLSTPYDFKFILSANPPLKLLKTKPEDFESLYNMISEFEHQVGVYDFFLNYSRQLAVTLIREIQEEYGLKNG